MRTALLVIVAGCSAPAKPAPPPQLPTTIAATTTVPTTTHDAGVDASAEPESCATSDECVALGEKMLQGGAAYTHDPTAAVAANSRALELFRVACTQGQPEGCEMVGDLLLSHPYYGLPQDDESAAIAFDRACGLENAHACYRLGFAYWEGLLTRVVVSGRVRPIDWPNDKTLGLRLLFQACDDYKQRDACKLLVDLRHAHAI